MKATGIVIVISITLIFLSGYFAKTSCLESWADTDMKSRWSWMTNCQIQLPNGTWIPATNWRTS